MVDRVKAMLPKFIDDLGPSGSLKVLNDRSISITQAVNDVEFTLALTVGLVALVIFIFLRRLSATLIPTLAVPISLIATLAAMYALGFSIDNISLLGLTLSVGLVVDDAIVMLENVVRHIEEGLPPLEAALKGSSEVGFTIVSITISLVAVFIPILLMGGVVGRIFNEFAMVVTISIIASSLVSLTLTPMLAARLPAQRRRRHSNDEGEAGGFLWRRLFGGYRAILDFCLKARPLVLLIFLATVGLSAWLFIVSPKGFLPQEDIGQISISTETRQDISFADMMTLQQKVADTVRHRPYVTQRRLHRRRRLRFIDCQPRQSLRRTEAEGRAPGDGCDPRRPPTLPWRDIRHRQLCRTGPESEDRRGFIEEPVSVRRPGHRPERAHRLVRQARRRHGPRPTFTDVTSDLQANAQQATLVIDRDKASALGITADQLRNSLYDGFGTNQASTIFKTGDSYEVIVEFDPAIPWTAERLDTLQIRSAITGKLIPLSTFASIRRTAGLLSVNQTGQLPAVTISFNLPQGVALGDATARIEAIKTQIALPATITTAFAGTAQVFQDAVAQSGPLAPRRRRDDLHRARHPLRELHPPADHPHRPAGRGCRRSPQLRLFGLDLSVIAIIGMLMLIGIVKKNAIMMIDFALVRQRAGETPPAAIREACLHPLPADHDDDHRGDHGIAADGARRRRQLGTASAPRHRRRRRPHCRRS